MTTATTHDTRETAVPKPPAPGPCAPGPARGIAPGSVAGQAPGSAPGPALGIAALIAVTCSTSISRTGDLWVHSVFRPNQAR